MIGLLLGTEEDWPRAFEEILGRLGPVAGLGGSRHVFGSERIALHWPRLLGIGLLAAGAALSLRK